MKSEQALELFLNIIQIESQQDNPNWQELLLNHVSNSFIDAIMSGLPMTTTLFSKLYLHLIDLEFPNDRTKLDAKLGHLVKWDKALIHALTKELNKQPPEYWKTNIKNKDDAMKFILGAICEV